MMRNAADRERSPIDHSSVDTPQATRAQVLGALLAVAVLAVGCSGGGGTPPITSNSGGGQSIASSAVGNSAGMRVAAKGTSRRASYVDVVLNDAPVAFYRLKELSGSTAYDSTSNGHNGSYNSNVVLGQVPLLKSDTSATSASFPSGYVTEQATWTAQAVTAECWLRPTSTDLQGSPRIFDNAWTDNDAKGFMMWISSGTVAFNTGWFGLVNTRGLKPNKTYYAAGTYSYATGVTLYVNGLAVANKPIGDSPTPNPQTGDSSTTYIGVLNTGSQFGLTDYFQGDISDCAVYDHALTPTQIANHYDVGANADVTPGPPPTPTPTPTATPPPTPTPSPLAYDSSSACINGKVYDNDVLPKGEGEFAQNGLDLSWWGRTRGNDIGGNQYSGFQTSWGRNQYDTWFSDPSDGLGLPFPIAYAQDTNAPGSPWGVQITAAQLPGNLAGTPAVGGAHWYAGVLDTPVDLRHGFFVARVRVPAPAPGMSPAWWMLTDNGTPQGPHGPLNGEWDIQEMFGNDYGNGMNSGTALWNSGASTPQNWGGTYDWPSSESTTPSGGYHDYGALLETGGAKISKDYYGPGGPGYVFGPSGTGVTNYLDGVPLYGHTGGANVVEHVGWKELMAMFQVGGGWLGTPNPSDFPAYYWVQWIRVYRQTAQHC